MKRRFSQYLSNSSALRGPPIQFPRLYVPGTAGIQFSRPLRCPPLTPEQLEAIATPEVTTITRHIDLQWLESAKNGHFRFGTIKGYSPKDQALNTGRFSDYQEGIHLSTYRTRSGFFRDFQTGDGGGLHNIGIFGAEHPVVVEFSVNDFCSCSSVGRFDIERARALRANGNPTLGAYVTYDLQALIRALEFLITRNASTRVHAVVGRKIEYGPKDKHWHIEESFRLDEHRDPIAIWLGTAFIKSPAYQHEEEYRLLLLDPRKPGQLEGQETMAFQHGSIVNAIIDTGEF
ncbi:DUF2971 domain-containing protein [Sinorhizobium medicae]|uniref:DUF2971 domain-containing protein n=1 Tax=Sinorhizobium medicae TaxID=110321 RepID=UPI001F437BF8|nr:DUF2971 domain-containing protein [Sinorhizobium medicae]